MTTRVLVLLATVLAAVVSLSLGGERRAPILRATAGGALQLESSRDGAAVLTASGLRPGGSAEGTLTLKNLAPSAQRLTLTTSDLQDTPGPGGGLLSGWVDLRVERGTDAVFEGKLADLATLDLGDLDPGSTTPFRFVVTLPEQGPAVDDAFAGGSVEVAWSWRGDAETGPEPEPEPEPLPEPSGDGDRPAGPADPPRAQPAPPRSDVAPSGHEAPPGSVDEAEGPAPTGDAQVRLWLGGRRGQRARGALGVSVLCRPDCAVRATARVKVGRRWRSLGRRALGTVASASRPEALRFRLSARGRRVLRRLARQHGALTVRIAVTAAAAGHVPVTKVRTLRLRP